MNQSSGEKKHTVLCVDDEENILRALKRVLRKENYNLLTANSGEEGIAILKENTVQLVLSDQRMPEMNGTDFFAEIKELYPETIRIILSGYTEISSITESINKGHIYKFFLKPWNDENLKLEIVKALDQYDLIQANKALTQTIIDQNEELRKANDTLESTVKDRTRTLELKNQALELSQAVLEELPYPVLCVGSDNLIVLINHKLRELLQEDSGGVIGEYANDFFSEDIMAYIPDILETGDNKIIPQQQVFGGKYDVYLSAMSGNFRGRGVIISILETIVCNDQ